MIRKSDNNKLKEYSLGVFCDPHDVNSIYTSRVQSFSDSDEWGVYIGTYGTNNPMLIDVFSNYEDAAEFADELWEQHKLHCANLK